MTEQIFLRTALAGLITLGWAATHLTLSAAQTVSLSELPPAPAGYRMDTTYLESGLVTYRSSDPEVFLEMDGRPASEESARDYLKAFSDKSYSTARGHVQGPIRTLDAPNGDAPKGDAPKGLDVAVRRIVKSKGKNRTFDLMIIRRDGKPIQIGWLHMADDERLDAAKRAELEALALTVEMPDAKLSPDQLNDLLALTQKEMARKRAAAKSPVKAKTQSRTQSRTQSKAPTKSSARTKPRTRAEVRKAKREEKARKRNLELAEMRLDPDERAPRQPRLKGVLYTWDMSGSTFQNMVHRATALYADGSAYIRPSVEPDRLDIAAAQRIEPKKWTEWRRAGKGYEIKTGNGEWRAPKNLVALAKPLKKGTRLDQYYEYVFTGGNLMSSYVSRGSVGFKKDGTFRSSSSSFSGSSMSDSSVYVARTCGPKGGGTATSVGGGLVGGTSRTDRSCGDGKSGTYEIDGYTLTLNRNNGTVSTMPIYVAGNYLMLGSRGYWKADGT